MRAPVPLANTEVAASTNPNQFQPHLHQEMGTTVIHTSPWAGFQVLPIPQGKTVPEMAALYSEPLMVKYTQPNFVEHLSPESK